MQHSTCRQQQPARHAGRCGTYLDDCRIDGIDWHHRITSRYRQTKWIGIEANYNRCFVRDCLQCADEALYDTDHTDLNSDIDEAELRRELLKDVSSVRLSVCGNALQPNVRSQKWRHLFDQFDPEGFGEIPVEEFLLALQSPALQAHVPMNKREQLYERAQKAKEPRGSGSVSFQEFVNVVSTVTRCARARTHVRINSSHNQKPRIAP